MATRYIVESNRPDRGGLPQTWTCKNLVTAHDRAKTIRGTFPADDKQLAEVTVRHFPTYLHRATFLDGEVITIIEAILAVLDRIDAGEDVTIS
ncbi:MAG: hypothetical protein M3Q39_15920 [Actinomycetota bacterium]|nr:hypothetical protein [Actinomycetota bacterium]